MPRVLGVDGARGGWVFASLSPALELTFSSSIESFFASHQEACQCILIDMIMGLPFSPETLRPEAMIHDLLGRHSASIFRVPCRASVYAENITDMYRLHETIMHQKLTPFSINLIPKIKELDIWLRYHQEMQSVIFESHPESAFELLNSERLKHSKHTKDGLQERFELLRSRIPDLSLPSLQAFSKQHRLPLDDVLDAIVLAYTAELYLSGQARLIPPHPQADEYGILMRAILPCPAKTPS